MGADFDLTAEADGARRIGGAHFSQDGRYRFLLERYWNTDLPPLAWAMMNPSTAGAREDDATIRRVIGFSHGFGYGGFVVFNATPYIATDPKELKRQSMDTLQHPDNGHFMRRALRLSEGRVVLAFGVPTRQLRPLYVQLYERLTHPTGFGVGEIRIFALATTNEGWPRHPLRLPRELPLRKWTWPNAG